MTALVQNIRRYGTAVTLPEWTGSHHRLGAVAVLIALTAMVGGWEVALQALSEAYLAVAVFVAGTLALVFAAERAFNTDLGVWLQRYRRWQVPVAALLGAFPGCGGAIVAITQYTRGYLSFGGVVATLTATMGDAMFLLLAREPHTAAGILILGIVVGVISGYVVDALHGADFMRPARDATVSAAATKRAAGPRPLGRSERLWLALVVPGVVIGIAAAFQIELGGQAAFWLGVVGALLALAMWIGNGGETGCDANACAEPPPLARAVIHNTNFVTAWVVFAFVGYEVVVKATGFELASFAVRGPLVPAMAVLVGLIPGCGPQILVTSMYLSGAAPLSAQLANALANDGDALFPAIAAAPKAALVATAYSAIPALLVGYGWYWIME